MKLRHRRRHIAFAVFNWFVDEKYQSRVARNDIGRKGWGNRHDGRMAWYRG